MTDPDRLFAEAVYYNANPTFKNWGVNVLAPQFQEGYFGPEPVKNPFGLDPRVGALDKQLTDLGAGRGLPGFDQAKWDSLTAERQRLNAQRWSEGMLAVDVSGSAVRQQVMDTLKSTDPAVQAALAKMGVPDFSVLTQDESAQAFLSTLRATIDAEGRAAAEGEAAAAREQERLASFQGILDDSAKATETTLADAEKTAEAYVNDPLANFDQQLQMQLARTAGTASTLARQLGVGAAAGVVADQSAQTQASAQSDRQAVFQDGLAKADEYLGRVYTDLAGREFDMEGLKASERLALQSQAADQLVSLIDNRIKTASQEEQAKLADLKNAIGEYQNATGDEQTRKALIKKIVGLGLGAVMAGAGAAIAVSAPGPGTLTGGALIGAGAGTIGRQV